MEGQKTRKVKKKRLSIKKLLIFLLLLYIIGYVGFYAFRLPIRNILITGTSHLSDVEIIEAARIKNYPTIFRTRNSSLIRRIRALDLVKDVTIKKNLWGKITINIEENRILFYNRNNNTLVLENKSEIENNNNHFGVPILINFVPDIIYESLIEALTKINPNIINLISEIEYSPLRNENIVIDESRFLLRMNDGNHVFVNTINILKLNNYKEIFITLDGEKGILNLDSATDSFFFQRFSSIPEEVEDEENEE